MLTNLGGKIKELFSSCPSIQSEENKVSISEIIYEEFVNAIRAAAAKGVSKLTISNSGVLEYLPDGSTSISIFNKSVVENILPENQTFFDFLFKILYIMFVNRGCDEIIMDAAGEMTSLLILKQLQLENVYDVSMQCFPEEIYIYIFYNEFEYYSCQAKKYQLSPIANREDKELYNRITSWATRHFFADCLNSYYDIIWTISFEARKGLFSLTISPDKIRSITHYDDSGSPISTQDYVISRLEKMGFKIEKEPITMVHFEYKISWTAKEFKIAEAINEVDAMQIFLKKLKGDYSRPYDDSFSFRR